MTDLSPSAGSATKTEPAPGRWLLDSAASSVALQHKSIWGLVNVKGEFTELSGGGELSPDGTARGTLVIAAGSLDTKHAKRDKHLRSADFFNVEKHPTLTFAVRGATRGANDTVQIAGDLTVLGNSRPLTFTARAIELSADAVTLTAELTVDRAWFGMTWNQMGSLRGLATVTLTTRFSRQGA